MPMFPVYYIHIICTVQNRLCGARSGSPQLCLTVFLDCPSTIDPKIQEARTMHIILCGANWEKGNRGHTGIYQNLRVDVEHHAAAIYVITVPLPLFTGADLGGGGGGGVQGVATPPPPPPM